MGAKSKIDVKFDQSDLVFWDVLWLLLCRQWTFMLTLQPRMLKLESIFSTISMSCDFQEYFVLLEDHELFRFSYFSSCEFTNKVAKAGSMLYNCFISHNLVCKDGNMSFSFATNGFVGDVRFASFNTKFLKC